MATSSSVRAARLRALVRDQRNAMAMQITRAARRLENAEALVTQLSSDQKFLEGQLKRFDARLQKLDEWKNEPVVLVRTSPGGYGKPVFHDSKNPCGYVWNRASFRPMLLAEAEEEGHGPCSSCGRQAIRRRLPDAA